ncbi:hypothetical protein [Mesorhizobium sp.]|uniref:hypothetical protein n=1 Tax=Mesorhizobium sp. TaxID=1871066 RepID=UPI000FE8CCA6|nr:hypothetical protein [Mesorhizobium sp.]RWE37437.1 MAG: hypothetical protein EOS77_02335 [Mesorhizobium sp.]
MISDRFFQGHAQRLVSGLRVGDRCDLECDCFADSDGYRYGSNHSDHPEFQFEFETVLAIERESEDCTRVDFESGFSCGFPPDHWIDVDGEQVRS